MISMLEPDDINLRDNNKYFILVVIIEGVSRQDS